LEPQRPKCPTQQVLISIYEAGSISIDSNFQELVVLGIAAVGYCLDGIDERSFSRQCLKKQHPLVLTDIE
jgi:hypothetical protein